MKKYIFTICLGLAVVILGSNSAMGRDAARDLKRMIGYTIVDASWVVNTIETKDGSKLVELGNGTTYKVELLLLDPLPITDVIVFAKKTGDVILVKLLIDNEAYDAFLVSKK